MIIDEDAYIEHFGVKGMRWGVRKENKSSSSTTKIKEEKPNRNKKAAIILGSVAASAAIAAGAIYVKKRMNVSVKETAKASETAKTFSKALADEPVGILHSSRGHGRGYAFLQGGGLKNPTKEAIEAGLDKADVGFFKRYGSNGEKVAARFADPLGRKDRAGRAIGHDVILPKSMAKDVHNIDDVEKVAWPKIKPLFDAFYKSEEGTYGPGF